MAAESPERAVRFVGDGAEFKFGEQEFLDELSTSEIKEGLLSPADQGAIVGAMESVTTLEEARAILREYP